MGYISWKNKYSPHLFGRTFGYWSLDTGSQLSMISKLVCDQHNLKIQPLSKLVDCDIVNGTQIEYEGLVELNFQVPDKNFSEGHLFLVVLQLNIMKKSLL